MAKTAKTDKVPAKITRTAPKASTTKKAGVAPKKITQSKDDEGDEDSTVEEDYLQKYQYMRERQLGHPDSNPREGKAKLMKDNLLSQPKVRIMIPVESGSDPSVPFDVTLNGYRLSLPRNTYIDVPEQVAEIVMTSQKQTTEALAQFRSDRKKDVQDALT